MSGTRTEFRPAAWVPRPITTSFTIANVCNLALRGCLYSVQHPTFWALATEVSRIAVKVTQADDEPRGRMRPDYANNADSLTMASHVVATNFQTIAAANAYWR